MRFEAAVYVFGNDVNTDEIIPARFLNTTDPAVLARNCMEDARPGFGATVKKGSIMVAGGNFGCGSSREHAPWALEANGIRLVIAESFARIFKRNMFNCGMMAVDLPQEAVAGLFADFRGRDAAVQTDLEAGVLRFSGEGIRREIAFAVSGFHLALVKAGGWVAYADARY
jgi:3-isopropylmalate/(R)-2-methylmalate dehydratase small subunit